MNAYKYFGSSLLAAALCFMLSQQAATADPLSGEVLTFQQQPMVRTTIGDINYFGHDELSTAHVLLTDSPFEHYAGRFMADDFASPVGGPVVHVRWWGSYLENLRDDGVQRFLISFERDAPASREEGRRFSRPGAPILSQIVTRGTLAPQSGMFTEKRVHPGGAPRHETLFEYSAQLAIPFEQEADTVYWLKIVALVDQFRIAPEFPAPVWGWHNRDYTQFDPLASQPPAVVPGEHATVFLHELPPLWQFQSAAVSGDVFVTDLLLPGADRLIVRQDAFAPENYRAGLDGPRLISQFSKDLAFELHTVPEPSTMFLLLTAALFLTARLARARRCKPSPGA